MPGFFMLCLGGIVVGLLVVPLQVGLIPIARLRARIRKMNDARASRRFAELPAPRRDYGY